MNKNTSAIDTNLYPKVVSSLMKNMGKYNAMISRFMAIRADAMYDTFPSSRIPYGTRDVMDLYDALGLTEQEIMQAISDAYFFQIRDFNPRAAKNAVTCLCCCIIRYFYNKNDKKNLDLANIASDLMGKFQPHNNYSCCENQHRRCCDYQQIFPVFPQKSDNFTAKQHHGNDSRRQNAEKHIKNSCTGNVNMTYIHIGGKLISAYILKNIAGNILKDIGLRVDRHCC